MKLSFKEFWSNYSYSSARIFIDQIAIAIFGVAVALGTASAAPTIGEKTATILTVVSSVFAILFFLFMVAELCFRQGAEDREKNENGSRTKNNFIGLYMGLLANVPNFVLILGYTVFSYIPATAGSASGFFGLATKLLMGEYLGLFSLKPAGAMLSSIPPMYFIAIIPCLLASFLGYYLGVNGIITIKPTKKDFE